MTIDDLIKKHPKRVFTIARIEPASHSDSDHWRWMAYWGTDGRPTEESGFERFIGKDLEEVIQRMAFSDLRNAKERVESLKEDLRNAELQLLKIQEKS